MKTNPKSILPLIFLFFTAAHAAAIQSIEDITITRDGIVLKGKFHLADGTGPFPTAILLHGFPGNETDVLGIGKRLSEADINALTFNYSGTYQSEGLYSFDNTQKDIRAAYDFINDLKNVTRYKIDTTRVFIGGYSYGGGMALTYAANHHEITSVFSIAGTDHCEFFREYFRNEEFKEMIDDMFDRLAAPAGPVRFPEGGMPKDVSEETIAAADSTYDLRKAAPLLSSKHILLIAGWDDLNVTMDHHILPLYRALQKEKADKMTIKAFQDDHAFNEVRPELAETIIDWIEEGSKKETGKGIQVSGTMAPKGPPAKAPVRTDAGESCIVDLKQGYSISGTLYGRMEIDFRILVAGPCGPPAGTFDEQWIAHGTFTGTMNGTDASGNLTYTAQVKAGGDVEGQIIFGHGLDGELNIRGNFSDGILSYHGWLESD